MPNVDLLSSQLKYAALSIILFVTTTFVNKYVLTTLRFQYPTIYQGWQTLVGVILFRVLLITNKVDASFADISRYQVLLWLPAMCLFLVSIYSGSVALSRIPIPIFLSFHNVTALIPHILELFAPKQFTFHLHRLLSGGGILISSICIFAFHYKTKFHAFKWLFLHVCSSSFILIYRHIIKRKLDIGEYLQTFLNYAFSTVFLIPSTVLLGDAVSAHHHFRFWYYYRFYFGCVVSGVCGICLLIVNINMKDKVMLSVGLVTAVAKVVAAGLSLAVFHYVPSSYADFWILINLFSCVLLEMTPTEQDKKVMFYIGNKDKGREDDMIV